MINNGLNSWKKAVSQKQPKKFFVKLYCKIMLAFLSALYQSTGFIGSGLQCSREDLCWGQGSLVCLQGQGLLVVLLLLWYSLFSGRKISTNFHYNAMYRVVQILNGDCFFIPTFSAKKQHTMWFGFQQLVCASGPDLHLANDILKIWKKCKSIWFSSK